MFGGVAFTTRCDVCVTVARVSTGPTGRAFQSFTHPPRCAALWSAPARAHRVLTFGASSPCIEWKCTTVASTPAGQSNRRGACSQVALQLTVGGTAPVLCFPHSPSAAHYPSLLHQRGSTVVTCVSCAWHTTTLVCLWLQRGKRNRLCARGWRCGTPVSRVPSSCTPLSQPRAHACTHPPNQPMN